MLYSNIHLIKRASSKTWKLFPASWMKRFLKEKKIFFIWLTRFCLNNLWFQITFKFCLNITILKIACHITYSSHLYESEPSLLAEKHLASVRMCQWSPFSQPSKWVEVLNLLTTLKKHLMTALQLGFHILVPLISLKSE